MKNDEHHGYSEHLEAQPSPSAQVSSASGLKLGTKLAKLVSTPQDMEEHVLSQRPSLTARAMATSSGRKAIFLGL